MSILWKYLQPVRWWVVLSLALAGAGQLLELIDPIILSKIIDQYAINPTNMSQAELIRGVLLWLAAAVAVALGARLARTFQDYVVQYVMQATGKALFNDGLRHTRRPLSVLIPCHEVSVVTLLHDVTSAAQH